MVHLKKILVTTDMSDYSLAAIEFASSFGLIYDARIYLLHVADILPPVLSLHGPETDSQIYRTRAEEDARRELEVFIARNINSRIKVIPVVRVGLPAEEIKRFADEEGIDLVVLATHGHTGLKHILMGSVAEKVVRISSVPVLTVKPSAVRESVIHNEDIESELHLS